MPDWQGLLPLKFGSRVDRVGLKAPPLQGSLTDCVCMATVLCCTKLCSSQYYTKAKDKLSTHQPDMLFSTPAAPSMHLLAHQNNMLGDCQYSKHGQIL